MIKLFFDGEKSYTNKSIENLRELSQNILRKRKDLDMVDIESMMELFNNFSKEIIINEETKNLEGIAFLSQWLKKTTLKRLVKTNFENLDILKNYVEKEGKLLIAQPRGLVGHWIAGNVAALGIFSLIQSILVKNANIMRIPENSVPIMIKLFNVLNKTSYNGLVGSKILSSTSIIYFPKEEKIHNEELSLLCDVRIIWGGKEAVEAISNLPKKETCEDVVFGPKYSFSIMDGETLEDDKFLSKNIDRFVQDIIFSEQESCTSPQILICETDQSGLEVVAQKIKASFEGLPERFRKKEVSMFQASKIIKIRGEYAIGENKKVISSKGTDWTILLDDNLCLEEPINSRTVFLKPCSDIMDVLKLITPKVQTIGYAFKNKERLIKLGNKLNMAGVSRIVPIGQMNHYDTPWDGKLLLTRLVNLNSLKLSLEDDQ